MLIQLRNETKIFVCAFSHKCILIFVKIFVHKLTKIVEIFAKIFVNVFVKCKICYFSQHFFSEHILFQICLKLPTLVKIIHSYAPSQVEKFSPKMKFFSRNEIS
jgi:hypothetical protein